MIQSRKSLVFLTGAFLLVVVAFIGHRTFSARSSLSDRIGLIHHPDATPSVKCPWNDLDRPLNILVLGQSNAGNHGEEMEPNAPRALFYYGGRCYLTAGPVPGATGSGGNMWAYMSPLLSSALGRNVVFSVLAVDATSIVDWTAEGALRALLQTTIRDGKAHGFVPALVLWQQGEADARMGMAGTKYGQELGKLIAYIRGELEGVKMIVAQSTRCRNEGSQEIRMALRESAHADSAIILGPDTDALAGGFRIDGCHFSRAGLVAASSLWASVITSEFSARSTNGSLGLVRKSDGRAEVFSMRGKNN